MKTNKAYTKRLRVTKNGKIIARRPGQNHYNALEERVRQIHKKGSQQIEMNRKNRTRFLAHS